MVVKLVLFMVILAIVLSIAVVASFWYLKHRAEMKHEKDLEEMEQTERLFDE